MINSIYKDYESNDEQQFLEEVYGLSDLWQLPFPLSEFMPYYD